MAPQFVDPRLPRRIDRWRSPALGLEMPIVTYGYAGQPLLLFPTAAADFLENERFWLLKAVEPLLMAGRLRVFSIDSINRLAWMDRKMSVPEQARRQALYSRYVEDEVVPFIRHICDDGGARALTTGASFGCFHAANSFFRRPDLFGGVIGMSGFYDLSGSYFKGYADQNCYFNNPMWYVANLKAARSICCVITRASRWSAVRATTKHHMRRARFTTCWTARVSRTRSISGDTM